MTADVSPAAGARRQAIFLGVCAAALVFSIAFAVPALTPMRVLWYYPLEHRWAYEIKPTGLAMDWFGRIALGVVLATPSGLVTARLTRRRRPLAPSTIGLVIGWTATAAIFAMSLYAYNLAMRHPKPEPLPSWYQPR